MPSPDKSLQWVLPPRQARTQRTLERLLDSAELLLRDKSFEDIPVSEIVLRADTSVAAFYRRFRDKNGLLHALHERFCEEAIATANDALEPKRWEGAGIRDILDVVIPFLIEVLRQRETLQRAVYRIALSDESMFERSFRLRRHVLKGLSELLLDRRDEIRHPDPSLAISFALVQVGALLTESYVTGMGDHSLLPSSDQQVAEELVQACCSYLFSSRYQ
jgi:AcrR family transcriptional regulator